MKKFLCALIAVLLCVQLVPSVALPAFAEEVTVPTVNDKTETCELDLTLMNLGEFCNVHFDPAFEEKLSDAERMLYTALVQGTEAGEERMDISACGMTDVDAFRAFLQDVLNTQLMDVRVSDRVTVVIRDGVIAEVHLSYLPQVFSRSASISTVEQGIAHALATVNDSMTNVEKALVLHDYLVREVDYDLGYFTDTIAMDSYRLEGVFIKRIAVCQGYALAYSRLLSELGIESYVVSSDEMNHAWNLINLDGNWFHVDCTWDDPTNEYEVDFCRGGFVDHTYFLRSDSEFLGLDHSGWVIQMSGETTPEASVENSYEGYLFRGDVGCINTLNGYYYALSSYYGSNILIRSKMDGTERTEYILPRTYDYLFAYGDYLYASTEKYVYELNPDGSENRIVAAAAGTIENFWLKLETMAYYESFSDDTVVKQVVNLEKGAENLITQGDFRFIVTGDSTCALVEYLGDSTDVSIPETVMGYAVTAIQGHVFEEKDIYRVSIPDTVVEIGDYAFFKTRLESVTLPAHLAVLGDRAFWNCNGLQTVTLPAALTSIGWEAFAYCFGLTNVYFEGAVPAEWGEDVFFTGYEWNPEGTEKFPVIKASLRYIEGSAGWTAPTWTDVHGTVYNCTSYDPEVEFDPTFCGNKIRWALEDGTLTITGEGVMWDYTWSKDTPWYNDRYMIQKIVVSEGITRIGSCAFQNAYNVREVLLPESLTVIGRSAFSGCSSLSSIIIPKNLNSLEDYAFENCQRLSAVYFQGNVPAGWGRDVFVCREWDEVNEVSVISIQTSLRYIQGNAGWTTPTWSDMYGYTYECTPYNPDALNDPTACGDYAHWSFANGTLTISGEGEMWDYGRGSTPWSKVTDPIYEIVVSEGITSIGRYAFAGLRQLKEVSLPESLREICEGAFENCAPISRIVLPKNLNTIGIGAFWYCNNLAEVFFAGDVPANWGKDAFVSSSNKVDGVVITYVSAALHYVAGAKGWTTPTWEDPHGQEYNCTPYNPDALNDPTACGDYTHWSYADGVLTITGQGSTWNYAERAEQPWIEYRYQIQKIVVAEGVTRLGNYVFSRIGNVIEVVLPDSLRIIGEGAFADCGMMTRVTVPKNVTTLSRGAFRYCGGLMNVYFEGAVPTDWGVDVFVAYWDWTDNSAESYPVIQTALRYLEGAAGWTTPTWTDVHGTVYNCSPYDPDAEFDPTACGDKAHWSYADGVLTITGEGELWDLGYSSAKPWEEYRWQIRKIVISEGITRIGNNVFCEMPNTAEIILPESLTEIGESAFANCDIASIILPKNLTSIGNYAFRYCGTLTTVYFEGKTPAQWGKNAFVANWNWDEETSQDVPVIQVTIRYVEGAEGWTTPTWTDAHGYTYECAPYNPEALNDPTACGDYAHWVYEDGVLTITGEGEMWDYARGDRTPWNEFRHQVVKIVVSEGITRIGNHAFENTGAREIVLPNTVEEIGSRAFIYASMDTIELPDSLVRIEESAFWNCFDLTRLILPAGVDYIGDRAFGSCSNLNRVYFEGDVPSYWGEELFLVWMDDDTRGIQVNLYYIEGAEGWTSPTWTDSNGYVYNTSIYDPAVINDPTACGDKAHWSFADGVLTITGEGALWDYGTAFDKPWESYRWRITKIVVSEGITRLGDYVFYNTGNAVEVSLPETLKEIGKRAFGACNGLVSILLPENVDVLEDESFVFSNSLMHVYFAGDVPAVWGQDPFRVRLDDNTQGVLVVLHYLDGTEGWTSPTWTDIHGVTYNSKIYTPETTFDPTACGDNAHWSFADGVLTITGEGALWDYHADSAKPWQQYRWEIERVIISEGITRIGNYTFESAGFGEIDLPDSLTDIGRGAFFSAGLSSIILSKNIDRIEGEAFAFCDGLTTVYFEGDVPAHWEENVFIVWVDENTRGVRVKLRYLDGAEGWSTPTWEDPHGYVYDCALYNPDTLNDPTACGDYAHWTYDNGTLTITGEGDMWDYAPQSVKPWSAHEAWIERLVVSEGITRIGSYAFSYLEIAEVSLPSTLMEIGRNAFAGAPVASLTLPESLTTIETEAFWNCYRLGRVVFPKNVDYIGDNAFVYCHSLTNIFFEGDVPAYWGRFAFAENYNNVNGEQFAEILAAIHYLEGTDGWTTPTWTDPYGITYNCTPYDPDILNDPTACGDQAHWNFADGTLTITGEGALWNYGNASSAPWYAYRSAIQKIVVSEGITRIGNRAFGNMYYLHKVELPETLIEIGERAFNNCYSLDRIVLPKNLRVLGDEAFAYCGVLTNVYFNGDVPEVWGMDVLVATWDYDEASGTGFPVIQANIYYLEGAGGWTTPTWTDRYGYTYNCAPYDPDEIARENPCGDNAEWDYFRGVLTITGEGAMWDYSVDEVPWDSYRWDISEVVVSEGITRIGNHAFQNLVYLRTVSLPASLEEIGEYAFAGCSQLGKILLPASLTALEAGAFRNCNTLANVYFEGDVPAVWGEDALVERYDGDVALIEAHLYCTEGAEGWTTPTWTDVHGHTFACSLFDPAVLKDPTACGDKAHWNFENGTLTISGEGAVWDYTITEKHPWEVHLEDIERIVISEGITRIGNFAFTHTLAAEISLPETLEEIGEGAFMENFRLETVYLPASLEKVEMGAFNNCICLRYAVFAGSPPMDWGESVFGDDTMDEDILESAVTICYMDETSGWTSPVWTDRYGMSHNCIKYDPAVINREDVCGPHASWSYANGVLTISGEGDMWLYAGFDTRPWDVYASDIRKVVIGEGITSAGAYAFSELGITEISLPASLKTVGYGAFAYCDYLEEVSLPASVDTLQTDAFYACDNLVRVTFAGDVPAKWGRDVFTLHYYMGRPVVNVTIRYQEGAEGWTTPVWVDPYDNEYNTEIISSTGFAVQGVLHVEGISDGIAIRLLDSDGKEVSGVSFTVTPVEGTESTYQYTVTGVQAGEYDLEISKPGALSYTICGIPVVGNMDLTENANAEISDIRMSIGDVNADGSIDLQDVAMLTSSNTYSRPYEEAENKSADVNGDRLFDLQDLAIITSTNNYSAKTVEVQYSNLGA